MASTSWLETPSARLPPLPLVMWPGILQGPQPCRAGYTVMHMPNALNHAGSLTRPQSMWHESEFMMASAYQPAIYASIHPSICPSILETVPTKASFLRFRVFFSFELEAGLDTHVSLGPETIAGWSPKGL